MLTPSTTIRSALSAIGASQSIATPQGLYTLVEDTAALQPLIDAYASTAAETQLADYREGDLHSAARIFSELIAAHATEEEKPLFDAFQRELEPPVRIDRSFEELARRKPFDPDASAQRYLSLLANALAFEVPLVANENGTFFARHVYYDFRRNGYAHTSLVERAEVHRKLFSSEKTEDRFCSPKYVLMRRLADGALIFVVSKYDIEHSTMTSWSFKTDAGKASIDGAMELIAAGYIHARRGEPMLLSIDGQSGTFPTKTSSIEDKGWLPDDDLERFAQDAGLDTAVEALAFGFPEFKVDILEAF